MLLNNNRENLVNPTRENLPTKKRSPIPGLSFERDPWQLCKKCICECFKTLRKHYVHKAEFCEDDPLYKHLLFEARDKNFSQTNYIPPLNFIMILFHRKYRTIRKIIILFTSPAETLEWWNQQPLQKPYLQTISPKYPICQQIWENCLQIGQNVLQIWLLSGIVGSSIPGFCRTAFH